MRRDTGPVCMTLQTEPKTTPRPMPKDASRIKERRTQLAPAVACARLGGRRARRGDGVHCFTGLASCFERVRVCAGSAAAAPPAAASWAWVLNGAAATGETPVSMAQRHGKVKSGRFKRLGLTDRPS